MSVEKDIYATDRDKLRELQTIFENAVKNNTIENIRPFTHPEFSFVSFTDKSFGDFDSFKQQWNFTRKELVGTGSFSTQLNPAPTLFVDDTAIAYGNAKNSLLDARGRNFNFTNNWTVIFKRQDGEWKVLRAHNSIDPFANPMLLSGVKNKVIKYSALSFMGGLILCSILSYLLLG